MPPPHRSRGVISAADGSEARWPKCRRHRAAVAASIQLLGLTLCGMASAAEAARRGGGGAAAAQLFGLARRGATGTAEGSKARWRRCRRRAADAARVQRLGAARRWRDRRC